MEELKKMLAKSPDDVFLNFSLAMELQAAGQEDDALCQFDRTIALDGNYLAAYERKGQVLIRLNRFKEAREALETGREAAQRVGDTHMADNIGRILEQLP
jgi:tetratricopeptide (TPR) repeat protein